MTADIDGWLDRFRDAWLSADIDAVMDLFADDVTYHETPFRTLDSLEELREEWAAVRDQEDIDLDLDVFARDGDRSAVRWDLAYTLDGERQRWRGVYLITLDDGRCTEFRQYGEQET